ncbi:MAG TPA: DNA-3-methyladenine glycosylase I [Bacteroidia bacterium]|nr:DNA-3-methyladenine glycosylase I [Bacteroidia bacterium]HNS13295.1 DNA-3-methyladenine glycosylase I [Bacteroidia bacterium]
MEKPKTYCKAVAMMDRDNVHVHYHDNEYGFPISEDDLLFERLIFEINQAGLSWTTILNKQENFRKAYHKFSIKKVASYKEKDRSRLLKDAGIIRNRLKVDAAIENAKTILGLQKDYGSFKAWLDHHHPLKKDEWVILFKKTFRFTGGEIVNEFLMSSGYLPGAHESSCKIYKKVALAKPAWMMKQKA